MSTNFKVKTKKLQNEQQRATLDFKHNEMVKHFANLKKSLVSKKKRLKQLNITLNELHDEYVTPELISKKLDIQEEIDNLTKDIEAIENNDEENKYYLENADLIFQYFHNINEVAKSEPNNTGGTKKYKTKKKVVPVSNPKNSVVSFFGKNSKIVDKKSIMFLIFCDCSIFHDFACFPMCCFSLF